MSLLDVRYAISLATGAVLVLAMEHLENFFCTPSWWDGISGEVSAKLHAKIACGGPTRTPTALMEPGLNAVAAGVAGSIGGLAR
jgi:hypothetical protein